MISSTTKPLSSVWANACSIGMSRAIKATAISVFILLGKDLKIFLFQRTFVNLVLQLLRQFNLSFVQNNVFDLIGNEFQRRYIVRDTVLVHFKEVVIILVLGLIIRIGFQK